MNFVILIAVILIARNLNQIALRRLDRGYNVGSSFIKNVAKCGALTQTSDYKLRLSAALPAMGYSASIMTDLAKRSCVPCKGGVPPLKGKELADLAGQVRGWKVVNEHHLEKSYNFSDFVSALEFVKAIGAVAEEQGHHPDILLRWGKVTVTIWTHKIDGLTESDFILAAKIDEIPRPQISY